MLKTILGAGFPDMPDPVGEGRLATWWKAMHDNAHCAGVLADHGKAFEGFVKMMAARR
jgi:hypothetical protein